VDEPRRADDPVRVDDELDLDAPDTIFGQLQRGRGAGHRRASVAPDGADLVLRCLAHDSRWDRQTDDRTDYLLRLVIALDVPATAIHLDAHDPDAGLGPAFDVLVGLSGRGSTDAAGALHEYLATAPDLDFGTTEAVWTGAGPAGRRGLRELVLGRISDDELAASVTRHVDGPWQAWADDPRVASAIDALPPIEHRVRPDLTSSSTADLHRLAARGDSFLESTAAFRELSRRGDRVLLDLAERLDLRNSFGVVPGLQRPLVGLGAVSIPRARTWVDSEDEWLCSLGRDVIAAHGEAADADQVLEWFDKAVADGEWCVTEDLATALGRLGPGSAVASLTHAWELTPHSYARQFYLRALVALDGPGLDAVLDEAVDDCEEPVREIAVLAVTPDTVGRREDPDLGRLPERP